ncbi:MAG: hypothetical protein DME24_05635 [Verrucomicrobia bacterium]|nr:MAG: hypothetical protein DME24_05635 [Verrucomicrobiota bacterium]
MKRAKAALRSAALTPLHRSTNRECRALSDDHFGSCSISICAVFIDTTNEPTRSGQLCRKFSANAANVVTETACALNQNRVQPLIGADEPPDNGFTVALTLRGAGI